MDDEPVLPLIERVDEIGGSVAAQIGKIDIFDMCSFVALDRAALRQALNYLASGKVKGRAVRARVLAGR